MMPRPPRSPLFPYTTLFRSAEGRHRAVDVPRAGAAAARARGDRRLPRRDQPARAEPPRPGAAARPGAARSEEHTSELQSRQYLVCRLLLEKKKYTCHTTPKT